MVNRLQLAYVTIMYGILLLAYLFSPIKKYFFVTGLLNSKSDFKFYIIEPNVTC